MKTRWGVLGPGMIATERTIPAIVASPCAQLAAVASRDEARARLMAGAYEHCAAYGSYQQLLDDPRIDAVYISLPNHLHREWTIASLRASKPVLCEKPLSLAPDDIRAIIAARDATGLRVEEAFAYRNHPQWARISALIQTGAIGQIVGAHGMLAKQFLDPADIRNDPALGGGALHDLGSYAISSFNTIFGRSPQRVVATCEIDTMFGIDRLTSGILDYGNAQASFTVGTQSGTDGWGTHQSLSILGTDGWIRADFPYAHARPTPCSVFVGDKRSVGNLATTTIPFAPINQYAAQIERFSTLVQGQAAPDWPIEDALRTALIVDALQQSSASGGWTKLAE